LKTVIQPPKLIIYNQKVLGGLEVRVGRSITWLAFKHKLQVSSRSLGLRLRVAGL
jgi:hypothetical protein